MASSSSSSSSSTGVNTENTAVLPQGGDLEAQISTVMASISANHASIVAAFHDLVENFPDLLALHFAMPLSLSTTPADSRALQVMILRQLLSRASPLWSRLSAPACLLSALNFAPNSRDIWDAVTDLAERLLPDPASRWDDLMLYLIDASSSQTPALQESALLVFRQVNIGGAFDDYSNCIIRLLGNCLQHTTSSDVRIAALGAAANIVQCLDTSRDKLQYLLPFMANVLTECSHPINEATATASLEVLVRLSYTDGSFLEPQVEVLAAGMIKIAEDKQATSATKSLAVKFLVNAAERAGFLIKLERTRGTTVQLPNFLDTLVKLLMQMLLDVENHTIWQIAESWDGDAPAVNGHSLAQLGIRRLANAFGDDIVPIVIILVQKYLTASKLEWNKHCAALIALAQIAKGCAKFVLKVLDQMVPFILEGFKHPHPGVQWAAINAIGQLSTDLGPNLQLYHHLIVQALVNAMGDSQCPEVQEFAASTVVIFSKKCSNAVLTQHLSQICSQFNVSCRGKQIVRGELRSSSDSVATPPPSAAASDQVVQIAPQSAVKRGLKLKRGRKRKQQPAQPMRPMKGNARAAFLKALSVAAVTTTATIIISVATVAWPEKPTTISKLLLTAMLYYGLPMTAIASAIAHAGEHDERWISTAISLLISQVIFTIIVGGGIIAFKHESQLVAAVLTLFTLIAYLIAWDFFFKQPWWLRRILQFCSDNLPSSVNLPPSLSIFDSIGGFFLWIKQRFTKPPGAQGVHNSGASAV